MTVSSEKQGRDEPLALRKFVGLGVYSPIQARSLGVSIDPKDIAGVPARTVAQKILSEVLRRRRPLDAASEDVLAVVNLEPRDAGFARAIASETLRRFGQLEALIRTFVPRSPPPHRAGPVLEILMAGACELLFLNVPAHAAVDAANRLAAADQKAVHFKSLINAVLRRVAEEGAATLASQDAARLNTPDWLWRRWRDSYGEEITRAIADAHAKQPAIDLMPKSANAVPLAGAIQLPGGSIRLVDPGRVDQLPGYAQGDWWVQDFAATLPARLLGDVRGQTVIDLCAGPGGKTMQLAAMGANVVAVEREQPRLARVAENLARTRLTAKLVQSDVRDFVPDQPAQFVLLDAPCSATGTIRRHPELPWIKGAGDIMLSAQGSGELLNAAADMTAPGGTLVFAVCSLEPEEGPDQVADFLRRNTGFRRSEIGAQELFGRSEFTTPDGDLRTLPCHFAEQGGMDGFYAARLVRL